MDFRILGPLELWIGSELIELPAARQRALLAACLLDANRVVSVARLVDAIWGEDPPASASALVQTYVSAVRKHLRAPAVLVTRAPGYLLRVGPGQLDLHRFDALVTDGRAAAERGDDRTAAAHLRKALDQWRGAALDGVDSAAARAEAVRLDNLRLCVLEERIEADLRSGRLQSSAAELAGMVAAHPLREGFRGKLMRALYRLGRPGDALEVYRQGHLAMRAELGIDPAPALQRLHRDILARQPLLDTPGGAAPVAIVAVTPTDTPRDPSGTAGVDRVIPRQLPFPVGDLSGRDVQLDDLRKRLRSAGSAGHFMVCSITGKPGIGKTALAVCAAHLAHDAFPDGQVFLSLHGSDPAAAVPVRESLGLALRALGVRASALPDAVDERAMLLRSRLAGRRVLLVIDDAADEAQARHLLPASTGCAALVTSRPALPGLVGPPRIDLGGLAADHAMTLLARVIGHDRVRAEPAAAAEIAHFCDGLPLALRIAAARLANRPEWPLAVLAARLRDERRRLDELEAGEPHVRSSLRLSYRTLPTPERVAFRRLGLLGRTAFSPGMLAAALAVSTAEAEGLLDRLADARLIDAAGMGADGEIRFRMDELVRLYAREQTEAETSNAGPAVTGPGVRHFRVAQ